MGKQTADTTGVPDGSWYLSSVTLYSWYHWPAFGVDPDWPADLHVPALPSSFVLGRIPHFTSSTQTSRSLSGCLAPGSFRIEFLARYR